MLGLGQGYLPRTGPGLRHQKEQSSLESVPVRRKNSQIPTRPTVCEQDLFSEPCEITTRVLIGRGTGCLCL